MKILFFGDVVGKPGRKALAAMLPQLKQDLPPDCVLANAENLAHGLGITEKTLNECREAGVDFFTSGNHVWEKADVNNLFADPATPLIRPENYPSEKPGAGHKLVSIGKESLLVVNLNGQVFIEEKFTSPFTAIDSVLKLYHDNPPGGIIVDFHAEATSEKVALGWYVDGRVSAVLGTHTHIPTADEKILPHGTAYISDVGMVGLKESVIGVDKEIVINNFLGTKTSAHDIPEHGPCILNAVFIEIDPVSRQAKSLNRIYREVTV